MSQANMTAGLVGKFGQSTFTSVSKLGQRDPGQSKPSKFFKSRNLNDVSEAILEEEEPDDSVEAEVDNTVVGNATGLETPLQGKTCSEKITVGVRLRPTKEKEGNILQVEDSQLVVDNDEKKTFNFDTVLGSEVSQETVYQDLVQGKVEAFLGGFSATIFAYGQTGTGKTFSMGTDNSMDLITSESRGIIIRSLQQIFSQEDFEEKKSKLWISFLEINKEQVFDLDTGKVPTKLNVRELQPGLFKVVDLTESPISSISDAVEILARGAKLRATKSTTLNCQSSRSHAVFTIRLESTEGDGTTTTRKLNLVDLAGSENQTKTKTVGDRFEEAKAINLGLTVLNRVVTGLVRRQKHIPYRDSMLTKVLKEGLQPACHISMLACISPGQADLNETLNTLRFCNEAKHLKLKPLPASILESCRASAAKKRELGLGISATPYSRANNTIHAGTPMSGNNARKRTGFMNKTIGTPGKRARTEEEYDTSSIMRGATSSTVCKVSSLQSLPSLPDLSCVSMIEPPLLEATVSSATSIQHDVTGLLSPLIRTVRETVQEEMMKIKSEMITSSVNPRKSVKSRATSSPNKTTLVLQDMDEDSDIVDNNIEVSVVDEREDIISGVGLRFPQLPRSVNPRHRAVMESASPKFESCDQPLFHYDSPPSSSRRDRSPSPTIEEMERNLGINPDSPSLMFNVTCQQPGTVVKKARKSSRRTTLVGTDLNLALKEIQNFSSNTRRRSVRVASKGVFYGSPSQKPEPGQAEEADVSQGIHPLLDQERKMDPEKQERHNRTILDFVNIGSAKLLGGLPAVGPKTAFLIHQHRELHGAYENFRQLSKIPGISKNFFGKFCSQNQIKLPAEDE